MKLPKLQQSRVKISVVLPQDFHSSFAYLFLIVYTYVCIWWLCTQECTSQGRQDPPGTGNISNHGSPGMEANKSGLQEQEVLLESAFSILFFLSFF